MFQTGRVTLTNLKRKLEIIKSKTASADDESEDILDANHSQDVTTKKRYRVIVFNYRPQGKVMFSEASVILSGGERQRPPSPYRDPLVLTSSGGHCSSRYASYWDPFLLFLLPPANEVCEGYVFTRICLSVYRGKGGLQAHTQGGG